MEKISASPQRRSSALFEPFEGPLDLLLRLIEEKELDITRIALSQVTDKYLAAIQGRAELPTEELADFLLIAAKLILIKSSVLVPSMASEEEGASLEAQLKMYKEFVEASKKVEILLRARQWAFYREEPLHAELVGFYEPRGVTGETLHEAFRHLLARIIPPQKLPCVTFARAVSIEEKIADLKEKIAQKMRFRFHEIIRSSRDKIEVIVSFLALLELIKQHFAVAHQEETFSDIDLQKAL